MLRMSDRLGQQAIVVGGSIAGLIAARVLSDYFEQVLVIERDEIADQPVIHKSIPQGNHLHALLHGGLQVLSLLYPAFTEDLRQRGATQITVGRDIVWYLPDGKAYSPTGSVRAAFDAGLEAYCASRGLIEFVIRKRTTAIPNIRFESGLAVRELIYRDGRVCGVRCAAAENIGTESCHHRKQYSLRSRAAAQPGEGPLSARLAHSLALRQGSVDRTDSSHSTAAAVTVLHDPSKTFSGARESAPD